ncbi:hypothetical protein WH50_11950 [Pokkaliibacter plantistimulans]|uniref:Integrase n=1 Tax=Pokkaliibacter plantistimulans TaxID=1635171 RepID=A0ABX5LWL2_9GAMM|nr:hypothetical protein WH50_11950 [Pokkaliibacter plantistimulans]
METCIKIIGKDKLVSSLLSKDIQALRIALSEQFAPSSANYYMAAFSAMLRWCEKNDYCQKENLAEELKAFRILKGKSADPYSYEEYQAIINACHESQHRNLATLAFYTGLRTGELRALCWNAVDLSNCAIHIKRHIGHPLDPFKLPKPGQTRSVDLQPPAIAAFTDQRRFNAHMNPIEITMHNGESLKKQSVLPVFNSECIAKRKTDLGMYLNSGTGHLWTTLLKRANVKHRRFYQCRHTFASWNLTSHGNLAYIAKQMGHSDLEMLQSVYGKWIESASKSEAEMNWSQMESKGHFAPITPQEDI